MEYQQPFGHSRETTMSKLLERPDQGIVFKPDNPTQDDMSMESIYGFSGVLLLIKTGEDRYACNNVTTPGPDPMNVDGIAVHPNEESANAYMASLGGLSGEIEKKKLEEIREIVKSKPKLKAILFFSGSQVVEVHYL